MKRKYIIPLLAVLVISLTACDDFLTNTPPSSIPQENAFETLEDCRAGLNGAYRSYYNCVVTFPAFFDAILDDAKYTRWGDGSYNGVRNFGWGANSLDGTMWPLYYSQIGKVNNLLEGVEKFGDIPEVKQMKGEAYLIRAIAHFELLRLYGDKYKKGQEASLRGIPYVYDSNLKAKERLSFAQCIANIEQDLQWSEGLLQARSSGKVFYLSPDALHAFQTRLYLYTEEYDKVIEASNKLTGYDLTGDRGLFSSIWQQDAALKEVIFMLGISATEATSGMSLSEAIYLCDKNRGGKYKSNFLPGSEIMDVYDKMNDIRWTAYFTPDMPMADGTTDNGEKLTLVTKYPGNPTLSTTDRINQTKIFRYAEVVLNRIEALFYADETKAMDELNLFKAKRIENFVDESLSGTALLDAIKLERRREFAFEGMRFHDLRRWNEGFTRTLDKYTEKSEAVSVSGNDYHWVLPIPQHEINANALPEDYQNPGYY